ncbi:MAG TPA: MBL fold metallo-hydrolase [Solirubrobacteraceae bacterium]
MAIAEHLESQLSVTWIGHATALIELDGVKLLTDPVLGDRVGPLVRIGRSVPLGLADRVDAVLISHLHADHADIPSLRRLHASTRILAPRGAAHWLARRGFDDVEELGPGEHAAIGTVRVTATPAAHRGGRWPIGPASEAIGFVAAGSQSCYFAGDTDLYPEMSELRERIDLALLPISGWGPRTGSGHLDHARAAAAARVIAPRVVVPIHWGTLARPWPFPAPPEPGLPAREFATAMAAEAPTVEVRVLAPGERTQIYRATPTVAGASPRA